MKNKPKSGNFFICPISDMTNPVLKYSQIPAYGLEEYNSGN